VAPVPHGAGAWKPQARLLGPGASGPALDHLGGLGLLIKLDRPTAELLDYLGSDRDAKQLAATPRLVPEIFGIRHETILGNNFDQTPGAPDRRNVTGERCSPG
jgi:hypothetical protein